MRASSTCFVCMILFLCVGSLIQPSLAWRTHGSPKKKAPKTPAICSLVKYTQRTVPEQRQSLIDFWVQYGPDPEYGGFYGTLDRMGRPLLNGTNGNKGVVDQARYLWMLSRYYQQYRDQITPAFARKLRSLADNLYNFIVDFMLDKTTNLFAWQVQRSGATLGNQINLYGNFFAIFGLATYAEAFGQKAAAAQALKSFNALDARTYDPIYGGYDQSNDTRSASFDIDQQNRTIPKGFNANLHGMESLAQLYRTTGDAKVKQRLISLIQVLTDKVFFPYPSRTKPPLQYGIMTFDRQWNPILRQGETAFPISHGHFLEYFWLLLETFDILGKQAPAQLRREAIEHALAAASYSSKFGSAGATGYCETNLIGVGCEGVNDRVWWVQDEAVLALWQLYNETGDLQYKTRFRQTYDWLLNEQTDKIYGEQFPIINASVPLSAGVNAQLIEFDQLYGAKASFWKAGYHSTRVFMNLERWIGEAQCR